MKNRLFLWNFYPPFLGAGIKITKVEDGVKAIEATLTLHWWNRNYIGTLFGGSIFSLCDPFHMVILMHQLGSDYTVRDKGGEIRFLKKASTRRVRARFEIPESEIENIRASKEDVQERRYSVQVTDENSQVIADFSKFLHIRRKSAEIK